ncbi:hypothetical protein F5Y08DRAFT_142158 [Xylaria arbuscula]|nr:hypothetical protein F5Y08DRAFT_142158 [Xylaria arbuscula]
MTDLNDIIPEGAPAGAPPPGVAPNYDNPQSMAPALSVLGFFLSLALLAVFIRVFVRFRFTKTWWWDDYTCIVAAAGSLTYAILYSKISVSDPVKHVWDIDISSYPNAIITQSLSVNGAVYQIAIFFTKLSILLLYLRIFSVNRTFTRVTIATIVIFTLTYIPLASLAIAFLVACDDLGKLIEEPFCSGYSIPALLFSAIFNVITDIWLLLLPFPLLVRLQLQTRQKLGLAAVFAAGLGACSASIARLAEILAHRGSTDYTWSQGIVAGFSNAEINIGIIVACASTFPVFVGQVKEWFTHIRNHSKHTRLTGSEPESCQTT